MEVREGVESALVLKKLHGKRKTNIISTASTSFDDEGRRFTRASVTTLACSSVAARTLPTAAIAGVVVVAAVVVVVTRRSWLTSADSSDAFH